jgi:hypothetical protein
VCKPVHKGRHRSSITYLTKRGNCPLADIRVLIP